MSADPLIRPETQAAKISGLVRRIIFRGQNDGFTILEIETARGGDHVVVLGEAAGVEVGESAYAEGYWQDDPAWGRRLKARVLRLSPPQDARAIEQYLAGGAVPGIGKALARRLRERFGDDLTGILNDQPERLAEIKGISKKLAQKCGAIWQDRQKGRDLVMFLQTHGLAGMRSQRILQAYGDQALERIMADPYRLARDIRGIGFATADHIAREIGMAEQSRERLRAALVQALKDAETEGHVALSRPRLIDAAARLLGIPSEAFDPACLESNLFHQEQMDGQDFVWLRNLHQLECEIAKNLDLRIRTGHGAEPPNQDRIARTVAGIEQELSIQLSQTQCDAVERSLHHPVFIITGGPGTGKTTILRAVLLALDRLGKKVALAAPTGRAAKRLTESTGEEAKTLHRLLEAEPDSGFHRNRARQLETDILIIDETSMIDVYLMHALLDALPISAGLILVGDAHQLPPVGPGMVLADLLRSSKIPMIELHDIFRQAAGSAIVQNAHKINAGTLPTFSREDGSDLFGVRAKGADDAVAKVIELVTKRIPKRFGFDPVDDIQVLCPVNRGIVGTEGLNKALQKTLNPGPDHRVDRFERTFSTGDKVMQTENDYTREIYNGDIGRITLIEPQSQMITVRFDTSLQTYAFDELGPLAPAYAVTVHKAQGSEYKAVVLVLLRQHGRMLRRNLLYTAVTRGRQLVVVVTDDEALERAVANTGDGRRVTFLQHRLSGKDVPVAR